MTPYALPNESLDGIWPTVNDVNEPLTEAGAAERFARLHGRDVLYDHQQHRWVIWTGHRWQPDADRAVTRIALQFARNWQRVALDVTDSKDREAVLKLALGLERGDKLNALLALAKDLLPIAVAGHQFDAHPMLFGAANGVIDLHKGLLRPGLREDYITLASSVAFDPDAECPRFERFLSEVFASYPDLPAFIQRAVGYCLTGHVAEQCLLFLFGVGANGKSTLVDVLLYLLGDYAQVLQFSVIEHDPRPGASSNELAGLRGRRFVVLSETSEGRRLDEGRVKWLTGGDRIRARRLYQESFEFSPTAKFWLLANHKPVVRDDSAGFWRRIRLVPFAETFAVNDRLRDELLAEAPGILAWAVRGCLQWQAHGLKAPDIVLQATRDFQRDSDVLGAFMDESLDAVPDATITAADLFELYRDWADRHHLSDRERLTATAFGRKAGERFASTKSSRGKLYRGIAKKQSDGFFLVNDGSRADSEKSSRKSVSREVTERPLNPPYPSSEDVDADRF